MALLPQWQLKTNGWLHDKSNIKGFFGNYRWLSNFHICPIEYEGLTYPSSENAYQAAKSEIVTVKAQFVNITPNTAKNLGRSITIRRDWEDVKLQKMEEILRIKFDEEDLKAALLSTEDKYLEETNWWNDKFWGVCNGKGLNHLGKILMKIRAELA